MSDHDSDDSGWEYEYHEEETESLYLNLDLSSHHGPLRPPRRRTTNENENENENDNDNEEDESTETTVLTTTESHGHSNGFPPADRLQILGLHTFNPIVSYQNQIFSCSWADHIGTELLLTPPDEIPSDPAPGPGPEAPATTAILTRGKDFDLIAANSVKLLGRKANLISSSGVAVSEPSSSGVTTTTAATTNQARFLDRLASAKQAKGETDAVRTVFSTRRAPHNVEERLRGWARTEEQMAEIQRLQEGVVRGDSRAMADLERVYLEMQEANH